jgi:parallel beta-helix repeat protein
VTAVNGVVAAAALAAAHFPAPAAPHPAAQTARAARVCDRVAAPSGSDSAPGTAREPLRSPGALVRSLRAGETGCLRAGSFRQTEVTIERARVTLRSAPGERASWRGRVVLAGDGDRLLDLDLDGRSARHALPSPTIDGADVTVSGNDITSPGTGICVSTSAWRGHVPDRFRIVRNRIHDCGRRPPTEHDHGVYVSDGRHGLVAENVIYRNADRGIQLFPAARDTTVAHNTVDGNGSGIVFSERSTHNVVHDNVFSNAVVRWNAESFALTGARNRFTRNCLLPGNARSYYDRNGGVDLPSLVAESGNRLAPSALYYDRAAGDFRLLWGTSCAGKGAPASVAAPR